MLPDPPAGQAAEVNEALLAFAKKARMNSLRKWHGVSEGDWYSLALKLAELSVPGLKVGKRSGRPVSKWPTFRIAQVRVDIEALRKRRPSLSVAQAAKILAASEWADQRAGWKVSAEDLRRHYDKADPWLVMLLQARDALRKK